MATVVEKDRSPWVTGASGLVGGLGGSAVAYAAVVAVYEPDERYADNLVGGLFASIEGLLVLAAFMSMGFLVGSLLGPALVLGLMRRGGVWRTAALTLLLDVAMVPSAVGLIGVLDAWDAPVWLSLGVGGLLVGGVTPLLARMLATRHRRNR